jgi:hypothetical protein
VTTGHYHLCVLICRPKNSFPRNNYSIFRDEILVAEVDFVEPEETGAIRIGDKTYTIANDKSWQAGERKLFAGESLLASSLKPSVIKQLFTVEAPDFNFELSCVGVFVKKYEVRQGEHLFGEISPFDFATQTATSTSPTPCRCICSSIRSGLSSCSGTGTRTAEPAAGEMSQAPYAGTASASPVKKISWISCDFVSSSTAIASKSTFFW